ncbi:integrase [Pseudomonas helleri]|uniref:Integrase n=1 Tax=Pseudomonas helleri TaxID=1608996 RepID=A0A7X1WYS6_9PSED|nr:integrase [Pseudomonas helleri]
MGCSNLVITRDDIKKYFCFIRYHDELLDVGLITPDEHHVATNEKRFVWENQILIRYPASIVNEIRVDADLRPIGVWSPTNIGVWS